MKFNTKHWLPFLSVLQEHRWIFHSNHYTFILSPHALASLPPYRLFLHSIHRTTARNRKVMKVTMVPSQAAPFPADDMPYQCNFWFFMICGCRERKTKVLFTSCGGNGTPGSEETQRNSTVSSRDTFRSTWKRNCTLREDRPIESGSVLPMSARYVIGAWNNIFSFGEVTNNIFGESNTQF